MRRHYLDNIRWITVGLVVLYHVIFMYNGVVTAGVIGPVWEIQYQDAVQYLLYKLAAFLAGTVTQEPLADLIGALGSAFGLMLGMTGSCALALLISIISSVSVVST